MEVAAEAYSRILFPTVFSIEHNLSELQKAMLDATPDCIKVISVDGLLLTMNRSGCRALNVPEDSGFGMPWLPLLPEDVHTLGQEGLKRAASGHNARFPGRSGSGTDVRYWDNLLIPIVDASGTVLSILCVSRDVTEKTELAKELESAIKRERLLSREMQHRIKNLFSVVSALTYFSEKEAAGKSMAENATRILREKLGALSRASDVAFAEPDEDDINARVDLQSFIVSVLQPYGDRCHVTGGQATINHNTTTTLALFLHEFATNSIKYGALGSDDGNVTIRSDTAGGALTLTWMERGGPPISALPINLGFGSEMVDRIVRSVGGSISRNWQTEGLVADLHLPN